MQITAYLCFTFPNDILMLSFCILHAVVGATRPNCRGRKNTTRNCLFISCRKTIDKFNRYYDIFIYCATHYECMGAKLQQLRKKKYVGLVECFFLLSYSLFSCT